MRTVWPTVVRFKILLDVHRVSVMGKTTLINKSFAWLFFLTPFSALHLVFTLHISDFRQMRVLTKLIQWQHRWERETLWCYWTHTHGNMWRTSTDARTSLTSSLNHHLHCHCRSNVSCQLISPDLYPWSTPVNKGPTTEWGGGGGWTLKLNCVFLQQ